MANKRMFSTDIVDTDKFLEMPISTQGLYFHLGMRADDDGFVSSPKKIVKLVNCTEDDLNNLFSNDYVIPFDSGVVVISDWYINNNKIKSDRYKETRYKAEFAKLSLENYRYIIGDNMEPLRRHSGTNMEPGWNQSGDNMELLRKQIGDNMEPQNRVDKNRIDKENISFEIFWNAYPKKQAKTAAEKVFRRLKIDDALLMTILSALELQKKSKQWQDKQFIPHPATWLNQRRWEDETDEPQNDVKLVMLGDNSFKLE